ncbi:MAG: 2-succinyl-5-enolpyruvyl-6-hydroxy-3-cyclohexene-1-carboxylate synthase, partial [Flavobacteriaceae bacterium]
VQNRSAKQLCKAFGLGYRSAASILGLKWHLKSFFRPSSRPQLLEIKTPRKLNDQVLLNYFKAMQAE